MPFGVMNGTAIFQSGMDSVFESYIPNSLCIFVDDICGYAPESSSAEAVTLTSVLPMRGGAEMITGTHGKRARGWCESSEEVTVAVLVVATGLVLVSSAAPVGRLE